MPCPSGYNRSGGYGPPPSGGERGSMVSIENREHLLELHRQEMRGSLERSASAAKAVGVSREELP